MAIGLHRFVHRRPVASSVAHQDSTTAGITLADTKANVMKVVTVFLNTPGKYLVVSTGTPHFGARTLAGGALADAIAYKD